MPLEPSPNLLRVIRWGLVCGLALACGWLAYTFVRLPVSEDPAPAPALSPEWPEPADFTTAQDSVFEKRTGRVSPQAGPLSSRFRLAGTFFAFDRLPGEPIERARRAILDDLQKTGQHLVGEGDRVEDIEVLRIHPERVVLKGPRGEEELWLSFADSEAGDKAAPASGRPEGAAKEEVVLETSRFGKKVAANRWVLSDEALRGYYREVLDDPERLASLYLSMKPDYVENELKGYYLDVEGEADFFKVIGLQGGDVVRRVNSMNMVSQARAEYFIGEFVKGRLGAVVLDIEREGEAQKLIYLIR